MTNLATASIKSLRNLSFPTHDMDRVALASEGEEREIWTRLRGVPNKIEPFLASDILFASPCGWKPFTLHKRR
jgi:hypothetical protein